MLPLKFFFTKHTIGNIVFLSYGFDFGLARSNFIKTVSHGWEGWLEWNDKGCELRINGTLIFLFWPHPWHWPSIWKDKYWKSCISAMGWSIELRQKGCEWICRVHYVGSSYDLDHGLSMSNFEKAPSQEWEGWLTWNEMDVRKQKFRPTLWLWTLTPPMT